LFFFPEIYYGFEKIDYFPIIKFGHGLPLHATISKVGLLNVPVLVPYTIDYNLYLKLRPLAEIGYTAGDT